MCTKLNSVWWHLRGEIIPHDTFTPLEKPRKQLLYILSSFSHFSRKQLTFKSIIAFIWVSFIRLVTMSQVQQRSAAIISQRSSSVQLQRRPLHRPAWRAAGCPFGARGWGGSSTPLIGGWTLTPARQQMTATHNVRSRLAKVVLFFPPLDAFKLRQQADRRLGLGRYFRVDRTLHCELTSNFIL